jgi:hypothetical protein
VFSLCPATKSVGFKECRRAGHESPTICYVEVKFAA